MKAGSSLCPRQDASAASRAENSEMTVISFASPTTTSDSPAAEPSPLEQPIFSESTSSTSTEEIAQQERRGKPDSEALQRLPTKSCQAGTRRKIFPVHWQHRGSEPISPSNLCPPSAITRRVYQGKKTLRRLQLDKSHRIPVQSPESATIQGGNRDQASTRNQHVPGS